MSVSEERGRISVSPLILAQIALLACALAGAVLIIAGFFGRFHPAFDALAVFRGALIWATAGTAGLLLLVRMKSQALCVAIVPVLAWASLVPHWHGNEASGGLTLYQKNLWWLNETPDETRREIESVGADLVTLQEVSAENEFILAPLAQIYPHQVRCPFRRVGNVVILSRFPVISGSTRCVPRQGYVAATLDTPHGLVTAVSIHLHWPWPHSQPQQVARMLPALKELEGPVVMGGDFNMVRWSHTVGQIAQATGTAPVGAAKVTFPLSPLPGAGLSIDTVLATGGAGSTELRPLAGSDHKGVLARISLKGAE